MQKRLIKQKKRKNRHKKIKNTKNQNISLYYNILNKKNTFFFLFLKK